MAIESCPHTGARLTSILDNRAMRSPEGVIYVNDTRSLDYGEDYFLSEYKNQYGKTYLEDEANLRRMANRRLDRIRTYLKPQSSVFEIGCATGFFLDEARKRGYDVKGIEISPFASAYARDTLRLDVKTEPFKAGKERYDAIVAFYVLEHMPDQKAAFQVITDMLNPGGIFVFALPSSNGPTFRFSPETWVKTHPRDHFADYSPASLDKILPHYSMKLRATWPASYHPARARGILRNPWIFRRYADFTSFGDTMEGVAQKL
ncbi:MAG: class I SAM-dependent methyltransferase [Leptospirales bacterium]|nr:class I SAM-dependent methyltransferase [Leptospirales bacterium]